MRIDIHAHYWTDDCLDLLADLGKTAAGTLRGLDAGDGQELDAWLRLIDRATRTCRCSPPRRSCLTLIDRVKAAAAVRFVNDRSAGPRPNDASTTGVSRIAVALAPFWEKAGCFSSTKEIT
jgi:6-methylsalicylate decarboxylase